MHNEQVYLAFFSLSMLSNGYVLSVFCAYAALRCYILKEDVCTATNSKIKHKIGLVFHVPTYCTMHTVLLKEIRFNNLGIMAM